MRPNGVIETIANRGKRSRNESSVKPNFSKNPSGVASTNRCADASSLANTPRSDSLSRSSMMLRLLALALMNVKLRSGSSILPANGGSSRLGSPPGRLDLDHIRAKIGQLPRRIGCRNIAQLDHPKMTERGFVVSRVCQDDYLAARIAKSFSPRRHEGHEGSETLVVLRAPTTRESRLVCARLAWIPAFAGMTVSR